MTTKNKNDKEKPGSLHNDKDINFPPVFAEEKLIEATGATTETTPDIIAEEDPFETPGYESAEPGDGP